jgi:hypothetical protein
VSAVRAAAYTTTGLLVAGLAIAVAVVGSGPAPGAEVALLASEKDGHLTLGNSASGEPIVSAAGLVPGEVVEGEVTIRRGGSQRARLSLSPRAPADAPGPHGGVLSSVLEARITEHKKLRSRTGDVRTKTTTIHAGALGSMDEIRLGYLGRRSLRAKRRYEFRIEFPDGGVPSSAASGDNAFQGSSTSVSFVWRAAPADAG